MFTPEEIREKLKDRNLTTVSRKAGVTYAEIHNLYTGRSTKPYYQVVKKLSDYLEKE